MGAGTSVPAPITIVSTAEAEVTLVEKKTIKMFLFWKKMTIFEAIS